MIRFWTMATSTSHGSFLEMLSHLKIWLANTRGAGQRLAWIHGMSNLGMQISVPKKRQGYWEGDKDIFKLTLPSPGSKYVQWIRGGVIMTPPWKTTLEVTFGFQLTSNQIRAQKLRVLTVQNQKFSKGCPKNQKNSEKKIFPKFFFQIFFHLEWCKIKF